MTEHPDSLKPIHRAPRALTPPYDTVDHRLFRQPHESHAQVHRRLVEIKKAVLLDALDGLPVTDYECSVLDWLGCWETHTVAVIAALLRRARSAPPAA